MADMEWFEWVDSWRSRLAGLDFRRIGAWPVGARAAMLAAFFSAALAVLHWLALSGMAAELKRLEALERSLQEERTGKALQAHRLEEIRAQSRAVEEIWTAKRLLLPKEVRLPELLDDIAHAAEANGLSIQGIELAQLRRSGFYAELPLSVVLVGRYHQIGAFLSAAAQLPRILTWHDFDLRPARQAEGLRLRIAAKTYIHLGDAE